MTNRCICCGEEIPEGRQVCPACDKGKTPEKGHELTWEEVHGCRQSK